MAILTVPALLLLVLVSSVMKGESTPLNLQGIPDSERMIRGAVAIKLSGENPDLENFGTVRAKRGLDEMKIGGSVLDNGAEEDSLLQIHTGAKVLGNTFSFQMDSSYDALEGDSIVSS